MLAVVPVAVVAGIVVTLALYWHGDRGGRAYDRRTDRVGSLARIFYLIVGRIPTDVELALLLNDRPVTIAHGHVTGPRPLSARPLSIVPPIDGGAA
ncbi:MAG: hypothetical protein ABS80_23955 [Pseudonocardia sp. SCN 72-51]|nr:MAG: hypothetical protein ABS80_23955 [Pseudonocardia sp. SCN 72-51]